MRELIFFPIDKDNPGEYISGCDFVGGIYLHGELQDCFGYDLVQADAITRNQLEELEDGIYDTCVCYPNITLDHFKRNKVIRSKLFFWKTDSVCTRKQFRGLICAVDDKDAIEDAQKKFDARSYWL